MSRGGGWTRTLALLAVVTALAAGALTLLRLRRAAGEERRRPELVVPPVELGARAHVDPATPAEREPVAPVDVATRPADEAPAIAQRDGHAPFVPLTGRVLSADDGRPVAGARVRASAARASSTTARSRSTRRDASGSASCRAIPMRP